MIQTVNDLRNALLFDMETDSDLAACEATCEIADYALESTLYDYHAGTATIATLEAADAASENAAKKKWDSFKSKAMDMIQAFLKAIRPMMNRLGKIATRVMNFVDSKRADSMADKLDKRDPNSKYASVNVDSSIADALKTGITADYTKTILDTVKAAKDGKIPELKDTEFFNPGEATGEKVAVTPAMAKGYLNGVAQNLSNLNKTFPKVDAIMKALSEEGDTTKKGAVKNVIYECYNVMSKATRKYFHAAMSIAQDLCKKDEAIDKQTKKANETRAKETSKAVGGKNEKQRAKAWDKANAQRDIAKKYNLKADASVEDAE